MSATIRTAQSAEMSGRARFERWREKFEAEFFQPAMLDMMRATLANLTPEQRRQLAQSTPMAYSRIMGKKEGEDYARSRSS